MVDLTRPIELGLEGSSEECRRAASRLAGIADRLDLAARTTREVGHGSVESVTT